MKNLIICETPLHVLIAERIVQIYPDEKFVGVFLTSSRYITTSKTQTYIDRLKNCTHNFYRFNIKNPKHIGGIISLLSINKYFKVDIYTTNYDKVFFAHIDSETTYYILRKITFNTLVTYDDGYANINKGGVYFKEKLTLKKKVIRFLFNIKMDLDSIKKESKKHITIYKSENAVNNLEYISLIDIKLEDVSNLPCSGEVSVFLGQPLNLIYKEFDSRFINRVLSKLEIDYYLPHPVENYKITINEITVLDIDVIAEDYICDLVLSGYKVTIYSFFSSTLFNVNNIPNVRVLSVKDSKLQKAFAEAYSNLEKLNIEILQI